MIPEAGLRASGMHWAGLSRRRFLKGTLALAGAAGAAPLLGGCGAAPGVGPDGRPLLFLDAREAAVMTALGDAIIPSQPAFPGLAEAEVIRRLDEELSFVGESIGSDVHAAISVLEFAPFVYGRLGRYSRLPTTARREVLTAMMGSRSEILRAVGTNLKLMLHFFYFAHPAVWPAMGYDGPFAGMEPKPSAQRRFYARRIGADGKGPAS